jgi:hypothetical protein
VSICRNCGQNHDTTACPAWQPQGSPKNQERSQYVSESMMLYRIVELLTEIRDELRRLNEP